MSLLVFDCFAALLALLSSHRWCRRRVSCRLCSYWLFIAGSKRLWQALCCRRYCSIRSIRLRRRSKTSLRLGDIKSPMLSYKLHYGGDGLGTQASEREAVAVRAARPLGAHERLHNNDCLWGGGEQSAGPTRPRFIRILSHPSRTSSSQTYSHLATTEQKQFRMS